LTVIFLAAFGALLGRLVQIQVINASYYQEVASRQHSTRVALPATRGYLFDRNGKLLASNLPELSYGADPVMIGDQAQTVARRFALAFDRPASTYLALLQKTDRRFVWLERRVSRSVSSRIQAAAFPGLVECSEPRRVYHFGRVTSTVIGFTNIDNRGLDGVELAFDELLRGQDGYVIMQRDGLGGKHPSVDFPRIDPVHGHDLVLTLDIDFQSIAEEEIRKGVEHTKALGGLVVMLDPRTGEILAMVSTPSFDPAEDVSGTLPKNRVIADMVEPGSVFKVVTAAAALERGVVTLDRTFDAEGGRYVVQLPGGRTRPITDTHAYGKLSFREAVEFSSNIVFAKVSDLIGVEAMYTTARKFGFGTKTGIELPGEVSGQLKKPTEWSGTTLNTMAYGYEVGVTPIQIACAYAAVANGGVLMKPYLVRTVLCGPDGDVEEIPPQEVRRVVSAATADTLMRLFEGVVERGTGKSARVPGLRIAGKTGTANRYQDGQYASGNNTASFVGMVPAEDPRLVCLVMLDRPSATGYTGGAACAPIFKEIVSRLAAISDRFSPGVREAETELPRGAVPDVASLGIEQARRMLEAAGFASAVQGGGDVVARQVPHAGRLLERGATVTLVTGPDPDAETTVAVVPDLRRLSIRRALTSLAVNRLEARVSGSGKVVSQHPGPGERVRPGTAIVLECRPPSSQGSAL
jgi:cell division protein FtsI (penicillin-binding protein 3)